MERWTALLVSSPSSNQLLLQFPTETEKKEFEQWLDQASKFLLQTESEVLAPTTPMKRSLATDQKLSQIERSQNAVRSEKLAQMERLKKNREGLLPWRSLPPNSVPPKTF